MEADELIAAGAILPLPRFARVARRDYRALWRLVARGSIPCTETPTGRIMVHARYIPLARELLDPPDNLADDAA